MGQTVPSGDGNDLLKYWRYRILQAEAQPHCMDRSQSTGSRLISLIMSDKYYGNIFIRGVVTQ